MRLAALVVLGAAAAGPVFASGGSSGASFLRLTPGARASALGGAYGAVAGDSLSTHYNPAGLGLLDRVEAAGGHEARFEGLSYDYAVLASPVLAWTDQARRVSDWGATAAAVYSLSASGIERRGLVETDQAAGRFGASDRAYALSYGAMLAGTGLALGGTAKIVESTLDSSRASAPTGDLGVLWRAAGGCLLGGGVRNAFGRLALGGAADPLPFVAYGAASWRRGSEWLVAAEADLARGDAAVLSLGLERARPVAAGITAAARGGWRSERSDAGGLGGLSLGFGAAWRGLEMDLAWMPGGRLGDVVQYSAKSRF